MPDPHPEHSHLLCAGAGRKPWVLQHNWNAGWRLIRILPTLLFASMPILAQPLDSTRQQATPQRAEYAENAALPSQAEWLGRASLLEKQRDWHGLLLLGRQWTWSDRDSALAWFVLGRAYSELKRNAEAIAAYQHALRLDPGDIHARNNLGNVYRDSQRYRDALYAYREAVRLNPDYLPAWHNMGRTFFVMKGQVGVIDAVERVRRTHPELANAWYSLLIGYYQTRNDTAAREALDLLKRLKPEEVDRLFAILLDRLQ
jgi:tetratricopeptide (TPR) repeat protein